MSAVSPVFARALALALGAAGMAALTACADDAPDRLAGFGDRVETGAQSGEEMPVAPPGVGEVPGAAQFSYDGALTQGGFVRGSAPAGAVSARLDDQDILLGEEGAFFAA
ncbi:MAG: hypothetical protein HRT63_07240, partial [Erythrobacter sp.]|nr:hypothetical protein [Erythrobacter sp.]